MVLKKRSYKNTRHLKNNDVCFTLLYLNQTK